MSRLIAKLKELFQRPRPSLRSSSDDDADFLAGAIETVRDLETKSGTRLAGPFYEDKRLAREALESSDVPPEHWDAFLIFHEKVGGIQDHLGLNRVVWGIVHPVSDWSERGAVEAEPDEEEPGIWHVHCADVHPSDTLTIDQNGRLYWCWQVWHAHYDDYFEKRFGDSRLGLDATAADHATQEGSSSRTP